MHPNLTIKTAGLITAVIVLVAIGVFIVTGGARRAVPDPNIPYCTTIDEVLYETKDFNSALTPTQVQQVRTAVRRMAALEPNGGPATVVLRDFRSGGALAVGTDQIAFFTHTMHDFNTLMLACGQRE